MTMTTPFKLLTALAGLSQREAAEYLEVRLDTVKSWASGRNAVPYAVIRSLRALIELIDLTADTMIDGFDLHGKGEISSEIELAVCGSDAEARKFGLPCVGAHDAMTARVIAQLHQPVRLVPVMTERPRPCPNPTCTPNS